METRRSAVEHESSLEIELNLHQLTFQFGFVFLEQRHRDKI